ncbi:alpha/beta hydrolase [Flavobacterium sp. CS20]|jgi:alpha-beta hydrolase superfamily lysophospholipase|uniref:alpha/beta hydrolase n=1 Tax=Flavobacterium sp. CS20 TaxID=2775246 RepID=UPI001B39E0C0|nr:alpha/beta fold hydrolase [Flavobacterium sp. CS20]QTY27834.1 alpha/beta fold hydrolase [Flavobacterium sp. CS20]
MKLYLTFLTFFVTLMAISQNSLQKTPNPKALNIDTSYETLTFPSKDGLEISARLYQAQSKAQPILLCHQARYNKQEYADIAPRLREMGYTALAIDQRSGGDFAGESNQTFERAKAQGISTDYVDAQQDIEAALDYLYQKTKQPVILWGSSYSSALVFFVAKKYPEKVKAVISFSPGNYFGDKRENLSIVFKELKQPFWVTSSLEESKLLSQLVNHNNLQQNQTQFIPKQKGHHGSKALWVNQIHSEEYWASLKAFLNSIK